jgi:hypothetical protein
LRGHQKRKRKPSITTLITQVRKAGERGPVRVALPDGTTITTEREPSVDQTTGNALDEWTAKHAH